MNTYSTRDDAIESEIITPLAEEASSHDIDAIADEVLGTEGEGPSYRWVCTVDADEFWTIVAKHAN